MGQGRVTPLSRVSQGKRKGKGSSRSERRSPPSTWTGASHPEPPRAARPHLHQLPGDPREAEPQRSAAQRPERPCALPPPRHLHTARPQVQELSDVRQAVGPVTAPWPAGARRWRSGRRLRAGIIYSSSVSGCCAGRRHIGAGGGPAPFPGDRTPDSPLPYPRTGTGCEWVGGRTGWGQVLEREVPPPFPARASVSPTGTRGGAGIC